MGQQVSIQHGVELGFLRTFFGSGNYGSYYLEMQGFTLHDGGAELEYSLHYVRGG